MTIFEIEIRHPHHASDNELEYMQVQSAEEVSAAFESMHWFNLQVLLLQLQGRQAYFMVSNAEAGQSIKISLNELAGVESIEFKLQSDIAIISERKDLFGLLKRKSTDYVEFKQLNLSKARECLNWFTHEKLEALKQQYLHGAIQVA